MSARIIKVIPKAGTTYGVDPGGATDIREHYQVVLDAPLENGEIFTEFDDGETSIPAMESEHPDRPGYYVSRYDVKQPAGADKATLDVTVIYSAEGYDENESEVLTNVEKWGWDDSTAERELVTDVTGAPVLNSAGDPFDSVPSVSTPAPVFMKAVRYKARQSGWFGKNCTVNSAAVTIGGQSFPARTLLCTVSEERVIGDETWPYRYTVRLRYRSNKQTIEGATTVTECGWDAVVVDTGMREKNATTGKLELIRVISAETGQPAAITSPALLDGAGNAQDPGGTRPIAPYNFRFKAYDETTWPEWFYSEPPVRTRPEPTPQT